MEAETYNYMPVMEEPPPPLQSDDPEMRENQQSTDELSLELAAEALTRQYMKLRMTGSLDGGPMTPYSDQYSINGTKTRRKSARKSKQEIPLLPPPRQKMYTPGPGAYSPQIDRFASTSLESHKYSFAGGAMGQKDRSFIKHYISQQASPGPMYVPNRETTSRLRKVEAVKFHKDAVESRKDYFHGEFTNSPCHNPGPGSYQVGVDNRGNKVEPGRATASYTMGRSSFHHPEDSFKKTCFITSGHERENYGVHSPGPQYYPDDSGTTKFDKIPSYSLRPKGTAVWDEQLKDKNNFVPGPTYLPLRDKKGGKFLESSPQHTFGRETQRPEATQNLSGTSFISEIHSKVANHSVHSPGPGTYSPDKPMMHDRSASFKFQGSKDRFYSRFEPSRIL